jgi:hypothetical protein
MLRNLLKRQLHAYEVSAASEGKSLGLQVVLWTLWTLCVAAVGYINWRADFVAQRPINLLGLAIHCILTGLIGLIVLTKIEMWLEPWRFLD